MAMSTQRSSVFTFESTVHSSHVLRFLNEQRCRDSLCDVTVVVEGQSFRAHRSVLASCSEYFAQRISSLAQQGTVITLPQEVTVAGFEPLLKFAYTSKLHFGKTDVLDIQNSASILGLRDLDEACFDFLLPKFFSSKSTSPPSLRKLCCKKKCKRQSSKENYGGESDNVLLDDKEVKPVDDSSSQQEVTWDCKKSENNTMESPNSTDTVAPVAEEMNDPALQCPKYRKFQLACEKDTCVPQKSLTSAVTSGIRDDCLYPCMPCSNNTETLLTPNTDRESKGATEEPRETEIHDTRTENCGNTWRVNMANKDTFVREGKWHDEVIGSNIIKLEVKMAHTSGIGSSEANIPKTSHLRPSELILRHCPLRAIDKDSAITRSLGHDMFDNDSNKKNKARETAELESGSTHQNIQIEAGRKVSDNACLDGGKGGQTANMDRTAIVTDDTRIRSTMESEVSEHHPSQLGLDKSTSQLNFQNTEAGCSTDVGGTWAQNPSVEWPKLYNDPSSTRNTCPFFQELEQIKCQWKPRGMSECEGASPSGVSSVNSGEDGDSETETEGDSESSTRERARQVQLPYPVDWIVNLSRNDFQQLLKQHVFTREQLDIVHDMRRRSKNRLAAQRCRKRKLDCIYNLQCEINKLRTEREKLMMEKSQLNQLKMKTCRSVTVLCQRVCDEANLQPEQLQVLTKYTSSDCPLSSFFPQSDAFLSQHGFPLQPHASLTACSGSFDMYETSEEDASSSSRDTLTGQQFL